MSKLWRELKSFVSSFVSKVGFGGAHPKFMKGTAAQKLSASDEILKSLF